MDNNRGITISVIMPVKNPHKYIYNDLDEIINMLYAIDNGSKPIDSDRWRLLQKKYR